MQKSSNNLEAEPPRRRRGAPKGNRNALKSGRYTGERKAFRRRVRAMLARANRAAAAADRMILARDDEAYAEAYADLLAAAGPAARRSAQGACDVASQGEAATLRRLEAAFGGVDGGHPRISPETEKQLAAVE
jgi:hypothetical protein